MSRKTRPAVTTTTCDRCGFSEVGRFSRGGMEVKAKAWARDALGNSAGGDHEYDFCRGCYDSFMNWIKDGGGEPMEPEPEPVHDTCRFNRAWVGPCGGSPVNEAGFCHKHEDEKCCKCAAFFGGAPLCDDCNHGH